MSESSSNSIVVRTDKGEYSGNETMYGCVYLKISEPVPDCQSVTLALRGFEKCQFQVAEVMSEDMVSSGNAGSVQKKYRCSTDEILNKTYTLLESAGGFPIGQYAYPFQIALPQELPGVFYYNNEKSGKVLQEALVQYVCCACLEGENGAVTLQNEVPVVVYNGTRSNPVSRSAVQTVKSYFCISRGDVYLELRIKQLSFESGDTAPVHITIRNESSVEIRSVSVKLIRVIKLISNNETIRLNMLKGFMQSTSLLSSLSEAHAVEEGAELRRDFTLIDNIYDSFCDGCQSQSVEQRVVNIPLTYRDAPLSPTTAGTIVKCSYLLDVETNIPWTPAIELSLPLTVKPKANTKWQNQELEEWTKGCTHTPVTGEIAVPTHLTNSVVFSSLPSFPPPAGDSTGPATGTVQGSS